MNVRPDELIVRDGRNSDERTLRLYRFLRDHGPIPRNVAMHWCGFPSPIEQPICAYSTFASAVMRLDGMLQKRGERVIGGVDTNEHYSIVGAA